MLMLETRTPRLREVASRPRSGTQGGCELRPRWPSPLSPADPLTPRLTRAILQTSAAKSPRPHFFFKGRKATSVQYSLGSPPHLHPKRTVDVAGSADTLRNDSTAASKVYAVHFWFIEHLKCPDTVLATSHTIPHLRLTTSRWVLPGPFDWDC